MSDGDGRVLRLGIVGLGRAAERIHLPALRRLGSIRVTAAANTGPRRLEEVAGRFDIPVRLTDYRLLLERPDVDAVAVLTPPATHAAVGTAALMAGKHVMIEKPLALSPEECGRLAGAAASSSRVVLTGFNLRWHRLILRARALLKAGVLGEVRALRCTGTHRHPRHATPAWHARRDLGGGVVFNNGIHHFDLWRFLSGREVIEVSCASRSSEDFDDETAVMTARLEGGVVAAGVFSLGSAPAMEVEVVGSRGRLLVDGYRFDGLRLFPAEADPGDKRLRLTALLRLVRDLPAAVPAVLGGGDFTRTYAAMWRHFAACVLDGARPECTVEDGARAVFVARAAVASAVAGRPRSVQGGLTAANPPRDGVVP